MRCHLRRRARPVQIAVGVPSIVLGFLPSLRERADRYPDERRAPQGRIHEVLQLLRAADVAAGQRWIILVAVFDPHFHGAGLRPDQQCGDFACGGGGKERRDGEREGGLRTLIPRRSR